MPAPLVEQFRAAAEELAAVLRRTSDPAFEASALDPGLVGRLQAVLAGVARAVAVASPRERNDACAHPAHAEYLRRLAQLQAALPAWQSRLVGYRAQLERKSERVHAARHWAEAYNRTR